MYFAYALDSPMPMLYLGSQYSRCIYRL